MRFPRVVYRLWSSYVWPSSCSVYMWSSCRSGWMSQLDVSRRQKEFQRSGSNASEGTDLPVRPRASRQKENFYLPCPLYRLPR